MTQRTVIDLTGRPTLIVRLNVDRPTKRAILRVLTEKHAAQREAQGKAPDPDFTPDVPDFVTVKLKEATFRDQAEWDEQRQTVGMTDPVGWTAQLLQDRCDDDVDIDVMKEVVRGMDGATMAQFQQAYITGALQDPKTLSAALGGVTTKLTAALLLQLGAGEPLPFSPLTTASDPGNGTDSPPANTAD